MNELNELLAVLQAANMVYQQGHWSVQGPNYYGNHLLLMRLYEETQPQIDGTGEKIVGAGGTVEITEQMRRMASYIGRWSQIQDLMQRSLVAATAVRDAVTSARSSLQKSGQLPIGLDNFLQGIADKKDNHIYLLQQTLR